MANNYYAPPPNQQYGGYSPAPNQYGPPPQQYGNPYNGQQQYQMPPQQPPMNYGPPPQPPPQNYSQPPPQNYNHPPPQQQFDHVQDPPPPYQTFEEKFAISKPKYRDLWAAILFLICSSGLIVVSGISINAYRATAPTNGKGIKDGRNNFGLSTNTVILFAFILALAFVVSSIYFWIARTFTKKLIYITGILNVVLGFATAVYYFYRKYYSAAIVFLIFSVFYAFCFWSWRSRMPFSVLMLQTAIDISKRFGHVFRVSALGGLAAIVAGAWFAVTFVSVYIKFLPSVNNPACNVKGGNCSSGALIGILVFVTFGFYWLSEVIKNVLHVSVSGVYGSWYFCIRTGLPKHPTLGAFKRAMTTSFGSICFGSLLVAIIQLLRQAASIAQQGEAMDGNIIGCCLFAVVGCILGCLQWIIEYFNHYAYSYIALYGDSYVTAAKATFNLMKDRGMDALVNDCLVDPVLTMGAVFVGYLCALLSYLYLQFTNPAYNRDGGFTPVVLAFSFLIGLQIANIFLVPIKSGVATIFTCMAHDPEVLRNDHPDLWDQIVRVYPDVQQGVMA
ncbi:plasma-membrane choline transporter-domain-containing protein [Pyronema omphalodes]|nr:plasma-membrane choline transporter-domain-containing protein [Pyronema omphalodes]